MATLPPTAAQVTQGRHDQAAEIRIERLFSIFVGAGYLGYIPLLAGAIAATAEHTAGWWTPFALTLTFGPPVVLLVAALTHHRTISTWAARAAAVGYIVAAATFGLAWDGQPVPGYLWFYAIPGVAALAAAITLSSRWALSAMVAAVIPANVYQHFAREDSFTDNVLVITLFSISFILLFLAAAIVAVRTGRVLDATRANTYAEAAAAAAADAQRSQRSHIDALLHDWVISTMLAAGRQGNSESVRRQATVTLGKLDAGPIALTRLPAATAMAQLRSGVLEVDLAQHIDARVEDDGIALPADVVDVIDAAVCEAVRNSILHAGPGASRTVSLHITGHGIDAVVADDGAGFAPGDVPPHRLGLAVSVLGRLRALPGGTAELITAPGEGTTVALSWTDDDQRTRAHERAAR